MCYNCWDDYGKPHHDTPLVRLAASIVRQVNHFGNLHALVEDWNATKPDIAYYLRLPHLTVAEGTLLRLLADMPHKHRISALALVEGYWQVED